MRKLIAIIIIIGFVAASCSSSGHVRKCNGQRGTKVPMGTL
ncbi:MAG: hypothetical protein AB7G44_13705 [Bacteroidia bacterium]